MVMPQQGGRETFRLLQQVVPLPPVLLMSGYAMDSEVQLLLDEGAKGFIQKPFRRVELSQRVAAACCGEGRGGDGRWSPSSVESVRLAAAG
jgi:DNA-binding NarL/FixJ family response regulator